MRKNIEKGDDSTELKLKMVVLYIILMILLLLVSGRLYAVMISDTASEVLGGQYTRKLDVAERRGFIYDRNGVAMNMKNDGYITVINPSECNDISALSEKASAASQMSQSEIYDRLLGNVPFIIVTEEELSFDGVVCYPRYIAGTECLPHIVGYTDRDGKGVSGIEKYFDKTLSGSLSGSVSYRYMSDAAGGIMRGTVSSILDNGYEESGGIYLTTDSKLQLFCEELVRSYDGSGAICVTDTNSGEIIASVSFPSFDTDNVAEYLDSEKGELVNRVFSAFTPGSLFKTVVAAAALEKDPLLFSSWTYECDGSFETEDADVIPCHKKDGHGVLDMKTAYAQSCNPYFISLAQYIGEEAIIEYAGKMGFCENDLIDGIFYYNNSIARYVDGESSKSGFLANLAIGQGRTLVSPISVCTVFSSAVTGYRSEPGIMLKICEGDKILRKYDEIRKCERVLSPEVSRYLLEMMKECTATGLGKEACPENVNIAGKTATAQTGSYNNENEEILNCWFCGVLPADNPQYTICVLCCKSENGNTAKEIFRLVSEHISDNLLSDK